MMMTEKRLSYWVGNGTRSPIPHSISQDYWIGYGGPVSHPVCLSRLGNVCRRQVPIRHTQLYHISICLNFAGCMHCHLLAKWEYTGLVVRAIRACDTVSKLENQVDQNEDRSQKRACNVGVTEYVGVVSILFQDSPGQLIPR